MQNEEVFIPAESFRVRQRYCPQFGIFYLLRQLFSIHAEGGKWWQKTLFYVLFTFPLTLVALALDTCSLLLYCAFLIFKKLIDILTAAAIALIQTAIKKTVGVILTLLSICFTVLLIWFKWDVIVELIKNLF